MLTHSSTYIRHAASTQVPLLQTRIHTHPIHAPPHPHERPNTNKHTRSRAHTPAKSYLSSITNEVISNHCALLFLRTDCALLFLRASGHAGGTELGAALRPPLSRAGTAATVTVMVRSRRSLGIEAVGDQAAIATRMAPG